MEPPKRFEDEPNPLAGYVDDWTDLTGFRGECIRMRGWARSPISGRPADSVIITDAGRRIVAEGQVTGSRPDVATNLQDPGMTASGWSVVLDTSLLGEGDHVLTAHAVDQGTSTAFKLQGIVSLSVPLHVGWQSRAPIGWPSGSTLTRRENARRNAAEMAEGRSLLESLPTEVHVELSTRCNLSCRMCFRSSAVFRGEHMSDELYALVKSQLFRTARDINLSQNGESMLHPRWDDIVQDVAGDGIRPRVITNGTLLNERRLRALVDAGFHVFFSIDAADSCTYALIRGASLTSVTTWVRRMHDYRRSSRNSRSQISVVFTPMLLNLHQLPELVRMASTWDVEHVGVHKFTPFTGTAQLAPENQLGRAQRIYDEAVRMARLHDVKLVVNGRTLNRRREPAGRRADAGSDPWGIPVRRPPYHGCGYPFSVAVVEVNGDVRPCCWASTPMGNLLYQNIWDIWNGDRWRSLRQRLVDRDPPEPCRSCHLLDYVVPLRRDA